VVPNVHDFPGHIACSALSNSEIVIPVLNANQEVWAVLDIDSESLDDFSPKDQKGLEALVRILETHLQLV
jgi:GAF domain-containing protein